MAGCGAVGADSSLGAAQVRFVEVSPGAPAMDFYVNGVGAAYSVGYANFTSYLPVSTGVSGVSATKSGTGQVLATAQAQFSGGRQYTAVVSHRLGSLQEHLYQDQDTPAPSGQIAVRVVNALESTTPVTVYVAPVEAKAEGAPPLMMSLGTGAASGYVNLPASGSYAVTATVAEAGLNLPVSSVTVRAVSGAVHTVVFAGPAQAGGHGAVGFALSDVDLP